MHRRNLNGTLSAWAGLSLMVAIAILLCTTLRAQTQPLGQKQTTTSGHLVTVYSISWPTPLSSVSADVEVCAGPNAPADSFAFPSFFQVHFADGGAIASYGSKNQPTLERTPQTMRARVARLRGHFWAKADRHSLSRNERRQEGH
jgi:hypothetical protein